MCVWSRDSLTSADRMAIIQTPRIFCAPYALFVNKLFIAEQIWDVMSPGKSVTSECLQYNTQLYLAHPCSNENRLGEGCLISEL